MMEEGKQIESSYSRKAIGKELVILIEKIKQKFYKEYHFYPSTVDITNMIAQRVNEHNLF